MHKTDSHQLQDSANLWDTEKEREESEREREVIANGWFGYN